MTAEQKQAAEKVRAAFREKRSAFVYWRARWILRQELPEITSDELHSLALALAREENQRRKS